MRLRRRAAARRRIRALNELALTDAVRSQVDAARPLLAAAHNPDPVVERAITESFVRGYRFVIWIATGLAALSSIAAWLVIEPGASPHAEEA